VSQVVDDSLEAGRDAARRHAWSAAYQLFQEANTERLLGAQDLERFAEAAWWTGRLEEAIDLRERAYAAYVEAGESRRAALVAITLSGDHGKKGAYSLASGWLSRGARLLENEPEGVEHGHLALARGMAATMMGQLQPAEEELTRALEVARRFGDRNLDAMASVFMGAALVTSGKVEQGLALLDEATAAAVSGELEPLTTGWVYCATIHSCQTLGDCGRAAEWTTAANRWCDRQEITGFPGVCRVHRAEIMRLQGDWDGAEKQAMQACEELGGYLHFVTAAGFYEIGEIKRRRGDFAEAEEAYAKAVELGHNAQPGLALLRLAQGKVEAAAAGIKRELATDELDPATRARLLPAQVEIALATGELGRARNAAAELEAIADRYRVDGRRTPHMEGTLQLALGHISLAERDWDGAAKASRAARSTWGKVGAPYETAQARMLLGMAYRAEGDEQSGRDEIRAARANFERLGAALDVQRAAELLGEVATARTFMFTDMIDSTKLVEAFGEEKWQKLLMWHDTRLRGLIEEAGGEVIKQTGDGYFAAFSGPAAAIEAAIGIQRALDAEPVAPDVRIGIHSGKAFHRDDDDWAGQGVHVAARIGALAGGGEILVSTESLGGGGRFTLSEPRSETLKGFEEPVELAAVEWR
jgi:class 3 adenylate cyclase